MFVVYWSVPYWFGDILKGNGFLAIIWIEVKVLFLQMIFCSLFVANVDDWPIDLQNSWAQMSLIYSPTVVRADDFLQIMILYFV